MLIDGLRLCISACRDGGCRASSRERRVVLHFPEIHCARALQRSLSLSFFRALSLSQTTTLPTMHANLLLLLRPFPLLALRCFSPFALTRLSSTCRKPYRRHRESFVRCAPTVRKLNERLQLCSRRCNEPRRSSPVRESCLFYKFIIGAPLRRITELPRSRARRFSSLRSLAVHAARAHFISFRRSL